MSSPYRDCLPLINPYLKQLHPIFLIRGHFQSILNHRRINTRARKHPGIIQLRGVCLNHIEFAKNLMCRNSSSVPCWSNCVMLALLGQDHSAFSLGLLWNSYSGKKWMHQVYFLLRFQPDSAIFGFRSPAILQLHHIHVKSLVHGIFYNGVLVCLFLHEDIGYEKLPEYQRFKVKALFLKVGSTLLKLQFLYEWGYWE